MDSPNKNAYACRGTEPTLTEAQIAELQPQAPEWQVKEVGGMKRLERVFKFKNFAQALEFTNKIGGVAEEENHHPLLITEWGRVTVYNRNPKKKRSQHREIIKA